MGKNKLWMTAGISALKRRCRNILVYTPGDVDMVNLFSDLIK